MSLRVLHLVTQDNQPYGSVRQCCQECGIMTIGPTAPIHTIEKAAWDEATQVEIARLGMIRCTDVLAAGGNPHAWEVEDVLA